MPKKSISNEECIRRCKIVHPQYNYDKTNFVNSRTKITVTCPIHGDFEVLYFNLLKGQLCKKCQTYGRKTQNECILDFINKHGYKYDYSNMNYINDMTKIIVICKIHGSFQVSPNHHKRGKGCPKCANKYITTEECIDKFKLKHNNLYDYTEVIYINSITNVIIKCKKCNNSFKCTPNDHLNGNGCPICNISKGEQKIKTWLIDNNIKYIYQHRFPDCKNKKPLPFDFYLPEYNTCIEYDGKQHFEIINISKNTATNINNHKKTILHDNIKTNYCRVNNINLIRIPYYNFNYMESILSEIMKL